MEWAKANTLALSHKASTFTRTKKPKSIATFLNGNIAGLNQYTSLTMLGRQQPRRIAWQ